MLVLMEARALLPEVDRRLAHRYGHPRLEREDPLTLLIRTILSQNTSDRNRDLAFEALRACWRTWEELLGAPEDAVAEAIKAAGLHHQRARRLHDVLSRVLREAGTLSLDFLGRLSPEAAEAWLLGLPGVGKKTAYIVLLMAFGIARFPVDTHIQRVTTRLGLLAPKAEPHAALAPLVPEGREEPLHLNLIRLGREVCAARRPQCALCPLADLCAHPAAKADPRLRRLLKQPTDAAVGVLVRYADGSVITARSDRSQLLAMLADPKVIAVEAATPVTPKEV